MHFRIDNELYFRFCKIAKISSAIQIIKKGVRPWKKLNFWLENVFPSWPIIITILKYWDFGFFSHGIQRNDFFLDFDKNEFFVQLSDWEQIYAQIFINTATWCMKYEGRLSVLRRRCRCAKLNRARCLFSSVWALYKKIPSSSFILEKIKIGNIAIVHFKPRLPLSNMFSWIKISDQYLLAVNWSKLPGGDKMD